jgi:hypothetical protein
VKIVLTAQLISMAALVISLVLLGSTQSIWYVVCGFLMCSISLRSGVSVWSLKLELPPMSKVVRRPINVKIPVHSKNSSGNGSPASSMVKPVTPSKSPAVGSPVYVHMHINANTHNNSNSSTSNLYVAASSHNVSKLSLVGSGKSNISVLGPLGGLGNAQLANKTGNDSFNYETEMLEFKSLIANAAHDLKTVGLFKTFSFGDVMVF